MLSGLKLHPLGFFCVMHQHSTNMNPFFCVTYWPTNVLDTDCSINWKDNQYTSILRPRLTPSARQIKKGYLSHMMSRMIKVIYDDELCSQSFVIVILIILR